MINPFRLDINETTRFLLPMVFTNTTYEELVANDFKEAYIGILDNPDYDDETIILKFSYDDYTEEHIDDVINALDREDLFIEKQDNVIFYSLPKTLREDYDNFLKGKYSKFSKENKGNIVEFWGEQNKSSILQDILDRNFSNSVETLLNEMLDKDIVDKMKRYTKEEWESVELWKPPNILLDELLFDRD